MHGTGNIISEFVKRSEEAKELGKARSDSDGKHCIPDEKSNNRISGNFTFFPSDF